MRLSTRTSRSKAAETYLRRMLRPAERMTGPLGLLGVL
jgi:hypothetical protein